MVNEKTAKYRGFSRAAWGYFFLNFDIHIGTLSLLPGFIGYLLLLSAIHLLSDARRDLLLRPLCIFLVAWDALGWFLGIFRAGVDGYFFILDLLIMVARLYFHFQFLTDVAALAEECLGALEHKGKQLAGNIRRHRTVYVLLNTVTAVFCTLARGQLLSAEWLSMVILPMLVCAVVSLMIMVTLFRLRKCFLEEAAGV